MPRCREAVSPPRCCTHPWGTSVLRWGHRPGGHRGRRARPAPTSFPGRVRPNLACAPSCMFTIERSDAEHDGTTVSLSIRFLAVRCVAVMCCTHLVGGAVAVELVPCSLAAYSCTICVKVSLYCPRTIIGIGATETSAIACASKLAVRPLIKVARLDEKCQWPGGKSFSMTPCHRTGRSNPSFSPIEKISKGSAGERLGVIKQLFPPGH